jgi:hypothetical protein
VTSCISIPYKVSNKYYLFRSHTVHDLGSWQFDAFPRRFVLVTYIDGIFELHKSSHAHNHYSCAQISMQTEIKALQMEHSRVLQRLQREHDAELDEVQLSAEDTMQDVMTKVR